MALPTAADEDVERSADPPAAARALERVAAAHPGAVERLEADRSLRTALVTVSAASPWLARVCATDPAALDVLSALDRPVAASGEDANPPSAPDPHRPLTRAKQLGLLRIAARDLLGLDGLELVGAGLAALADSLLGQAWQLTEATSEGMAVIGMGKLGAQELNYSSDVDVLLVADDRAAGIDPRPFIERARHAWRVDLDLRPEGRSGPALRTFGSYQAYWARWAQAWELQALLKARPVAGPERLGQDFFTAAARRVWEHPFDTEDLRQLRRMKTRSESELTRRGLAERELKRGPGGIRDVEFALQILQLVHGGADPTLRVRSTIEAIRALARGGYVASDDAEALEAAYRFLRTVEHRLQLYEGEQVHTLPSSPARLDHLARVLGYGRNGIPALDGFDADLRRHRATARSIHERLFFRPLLEAFSTGSSGTPTPAAPAQHAWQPALPESAVPVRLAAFGFTDAARTRQAVVELTRGFTRTSQLMQQMLPLLLDWLSEAPDPDQGLFGLRALAGEPHSGGRLTELCRESPAGARQLCRLLGTSPRFTRDLQRHPDLLSDLAGGDPPSHPRAELDERVERSLAWRSGQGAVAAGLRLFAGAEGLRIASRDVLGVDGTDATGRALSDLADSVLAAAFRQTAAEVPMAIIGMGRLGGREMAYSSDVDLLIVYDQAGSDADRAAASAASAFIKLVAGTTPATGMYRVDLALRPEGRHGPAARSVDGYAAYYDRWARAWERQALLRGRFVAGDPLVGARFESLAVDFLWNRRFDDADAREIRRTKARMERERVPPGEDPKFHLKLGPGSLSDVEWTVQLLQLEHGVRAAGTMEALDLLRNTGVVSSDDASVLAEAYRFCESARNRLSLVRDLPGADALPTTGPSLSVLARSLGFSASGLRNEYGRLTRRSRKVVERLFYGRG